MKNILNRTCLGIIVAVFFAAMFSVVIVSSPASAQSTSAAWVDNWNLEYGGNAYTSDDMNQDWVFYRTSDPDGCVDYIDDISWDPSKKDLDKIDDPGDDDTTAEYIANAPSASGGCLKADPVEISLTSPQNAMLSFTWDGEVLKTTNSEEPISFSFDQTNLNLYIRDGDNQCKDSITVGANKATAEIIIRTTEKNRFSKGPLAGDGAKTDDLWNAYDGEDSANSGHAWISAADYDRVENQCFVSQVAQINISNVADFREPGQGTVSGNPVGGSSTATSSTCESEGGIFSWVLCAALEWATKTFEVADSWINDQLEFSSTYYEDAYVKEAWANIRNIAYIILIPIMLVMVIGTALGFSFLDAYTVKRALPRLFIAVIFMALSYNLMILMIEIVNVVGNGIGGLIAAPFGGTEALTLEGIFNPSNGDSAAILGFGSIALGGLALGAISVVSLGVLVSYFFIAALSILTVFFLLVFRQMILIGLMVVAPLAILAWIFPGNDKMWKLWWSSFSKLLYLYPIIVGALITGRAFASIVPSGEGAADSLITILIKLTAFIGPFFLIPAIFRYAGGAFANLAGIVNNRSKGIFDKQRNYRGAKKKENWANTKSGNRFSERNALSRRFNRVGMGVGAGAKGHFGVGKRGDQAMDMAGQTAADEALKNNHALQKLAFHDNANAVMALSGGSRQGAEEAAKQLFTDASGVYDKAKGDEAIAGAAAVGFTRSNAQAALTTLAQNKSRAVAAGAAGRRIIDDGIARLAPGNSIQAGNLRDSFAYNSSGAGRGDLGATDWGAKSTSSGVSTAGLEGFRRTGLYQAGNGHDRAVTGATDDAVNLLATGQQEDVLKAEAHLIELENIGNNASGPVADRAMKEAERLRQARDTNAVATATLAAPSGRLTQDPSGPPGTMIQRTVRSDIDGQRALFDAAYRARYTPAQLAAGYTERAETNADVAREAARTYTPVDPNKL